MDANGRLKSLLLSLIACLGSAGLGSLSGCTLPNAMRATTPSAEPRTEVVADPSVPGAEGELGYAAAEDPEFNHVEEWASQVAAQVARRDDVRVRLDRAETASVEAASVPEFDPTEPVAIDSVAPSVIPDSATPKPGASASTGAPAARSMLDGSKPAVHANADRDDPAPASSQPPVLKTLTLRPQASIAVADTAPVPLAAANAPRRAFGPNGTLEEFLERLAEEPADASFREQLERRVLHAVAGVDEAARAPLQMFSDSQRELAAGFIDLFIYLRDMPDGSTDGSLRAASRAVERLLSAIREVSDLRIATLAICRRVDGFGQYTPIAPPEFPAGAGSEFVTYCEIADFVSRLDEAGAYVSEFSMQVAVLNRIGEKVHEFAAESIVDRCRSRRNDCFIAPLIRLPATLSPGEYVVKVTIVDTIGQKVAERTAPLRIVSGS